MFFEWTSISRPQIWLVHHHIVKSLQRSLGNIRGRVLDLGCGIKPYEKIIKPNCQEYIGIDWPLTLHSLKAADVLERRVEPSFQGRQLRQLRYTQFGLRYLAVQAGLESSP